MILNMFKSQGQTELSKVKPGAVFWRGEMLHIKTNEADPDGDIITVDLVTGAVHRYPPDNMVEVVPDAAVVNNAPPNIPG